MRAVLLAVAVLMGTPALAQEPGRFTMMPSAQGFLRLDTRTGAVSYCTVQEGTPSCRSGPDERAALEAEIDRLKGAQAPALRLPSDAEADRAIGLMQRFMRGMMSAIKESDKPPL